MRSPSCWTGRTAATRAPRRSRRALGGGARRPQGRGVRRAPLGDGLQERWRRWPSGGCARRCAAAVPTCRRSEPLGRFLALCREAAVPFKATAGLHHPLAAEGRHGFLNVLAACAFADEAALTGDVRLTPAALSWQGAPPGRTSSSESASSCRRRQLLLLRAARRARRAGDPVIQGFGTFVRGSKRHLRLSPRRRRRRPRLRLARRAAPARPRA